MKSKIVLALAAVLVMTFGALHEAAAQGSMGRGMGGMGQGSMDQGSMEPGGTIGQANEAMADGEVRNVDKDAGKVTIRHGAIAELDMPPMTMVYRVKEPASHCEGNL